MKKVFRCIADAIHQADPLAAFTFEFWDGDKIAYGNQSKVVLHFKSTRSAREILKKDFTGLGEAYMLGEVDVEGDLRELLRLGLALKFYENGLGLWRKFLVLCAYLTNGSTPERCQKDIARHYDLGNDFYALFLDKTMTYSCAYFKNDDDSLEAAQTNKYEHIARKLMLKRGERLIDIGCGWGGMLIYAAQKYGVTGVGNTLSRNQYEYANRKIRELGLTGRIEVLLQDYRQCTGEFDKLVSIGMFEHVGKRSIPVFMQKVSGLLKKGGLGLLHTIGKEIYSPTDPWITRYIFPGGYLPDLPEIVQNMGLVELSILDVENLRMHYSRTLDHWAENYEKNVERVRAMFDDVFVRMWRFYLLSCSAGFKYGFIRLYQILFSNGLNNELPMTREHIYVTPGVLRR
jgi:cyclopropane-fatty-acyl-phospholipid synthase